MRCPIDDVDLVMTERQGIEIDYCPKCRGVWLDRGELDKIIDRDDDAERDDDRYERRREPEDRHDERSHGRPQHKHKRKSMLSELFEF